MNHELRERGLKMSEFTIKKFAEIVGVNQSTIRIYTKKGLIKPVRVSPSGYNYYDESSVDRFRLIRKIIENERAYLSEIPKILGEE